MVKDLSILSKLKFVFLNKFVKNYYFFQIKNLEVIQSPEIVTTTLERVTMFSANIKCGMITNISVGELIGGRPELASRDFHILESFIKTVWDNSIFRIIEGAGLDVIADNLEINLFSPDIKLDTLAECDDRFNQLSAKKLYVEITKGK